MSLENSGEIWARNYRGRCHWLVDGSYRHEMAIITPGDYREEEEWVQTAVGKIYIEKKEVFRYALTKDCFSGDTIGGLTGSKYPM